MGEVHEPESELHSAEEALADAVRLRQVLRPAGPEKKESAMTMHITIEVPDGLGRQLQRFQERLPEILERGLREVSAEGGEAFKDENTILDLLASQPAPEQVLALRPSPELQTRVSELLARSKAGELSRQEEAELERYLLLEHLVRLAKTHAYQQTRR